MLIVPTAEFPPEIPSTLQVTAEFVVLPTVAVNDCVSPSKTEAEMGETLTVTARGREL